MEYDRAVCIARSGDAGVAPLDVWIAGDLNPSDDVAEQFAESLRARALTQAYSADVVTHCKGRCLDVVAGPQVHVAAGAHLVAVHNGAHCRALGCARKECGHLREAFGSEDLDHYPVT